MSKIQPIVALLNSSRFQQILLIIMAVATVFGVLYCDCTSFWPDFVGPHHEAFTAMRFAQDLIDVPPLMARVEQCKTFSQTISFWTNDYTPGVPFYRPLSLTCFWLQYQAFGCDHFNRWLLVSIVIHLTFCLLLAFFLKRLTGSTSVAIISLLVFGAYRVINAGVLSNFWLMGEPPSLTAVINWKDQPTQLADIGTLLALMFAQREKWIFGLFCAMTAVLFKESGWISYAMVVILLIGTGRIGRVPVWVYFSAIACICLPLVLRYSSGMGLIGGEHIGTNMNWYVRYFNVVSGAYVQGFSTPCWPAALFATALYGVVRLRRVTLLIRLALAVLALAIGSLLEARISQTSAAVGMVMLVDSQLRLPYVCTCFGFLVIGAILFEDVELRKDAAVLIALFLVAAMPYVAASQVSRHALEMCYALQSAVVGCAWTATYRRCRSTIQEKIPGLSTGDAERLVPLAEPTT
jgi:hypothetical protein